MPQSLVLNLVTLSAIPQQHLQGYSLQQLFFSLVETVDPALGNVLRCDDQNRSYSLSALQVADLSQQTSDAEQAGDSGQANGSEQGVDPSIATPLGNLRVLNAKARRENQAEISGRGESAGVDKSGTGKPERTFAARRSHKRRAQLARTQLKYSHEESLPAGTACWWRISFLDDDLFDHLIFLWNQLQDEPFAVGAGSVMIKSIEDDVPAAEWACSCSYRDIYERASARELDIHLQFVTPTAFEQAGQITALPTAEAVFHPLRRRWNRYGGLAFAPSLIDNIVPTHFDIQTEITQRFRRRLSEYITGCTGQISFRIAGDADPLLVKRINTLANFTRYCAIGCNTRLGMGVVRRLSGPISLSFRPGYAPQIN